MKYFSILILLCLYKSLLFGMDNETLIESLPQELITQIIAAADIPTKNTMRGVCTAWQNLSSKNNLDIYRYPSVILSQALENYAFQYALYRNDIHVIECLKISQNKPNYDAHDVGWYKKQISQENPAPDYFLASFFGNSTSLKNYCADKKNPINYTEKKNKLTALYYAAKYGHTECVALLLQQENVTELINVPENSPFYQAVKYGHVAIVELFLNHTNISLTSLSSGLIECLEQINHTSHFAYIIELLWQKGLFTTKLSQSGNTLLSIVSADGPAHIVEKILEQLPRDPIIKIQGINPLAVAIENEQNEIMKLLLKHLPKLVNRCSRSNTSPLHLAVQKNNVEAVQILLGIQGIKYNMLNKQGLTPLDFADNNNNQVIIDLLHQRGALTKQK